MICREWAGEGIDYEISRRVCEKEPRVCSVCGVAGNERSDGCERTLRIDCSHDVAFQEVGAIHID